MNNIKQQIEIISSDLFITLDKFKRIELVRDIAQNFCNELNIPYLDFVVEDFKNKTDGDYSARKNELKLNIHFFEDTDNNYTNGEHLGMHLLMKIFHEYTHYYQHLQSKDLQESELYKELIDPITDDIFYHLQETEINANNTSIYELKRCA